MQLEVTVEATGGTTTGIRLPTGALDELGGGKRPRVLVTFPDGTTARTSVGVHDGSPFLPLSAALRAEAGLAAGDELTIEVVRDEAPREVEVPEDLAAALAGEPEARAFFDGLTASQRKGFVTSVTSAKQAQTRERRVGAAVAALRDGRKRP